MSELLFSGLKVIDCGSYIAAPAATMILADLGADVVKIEPLGAGDPYRQVHRLPGNPAADLDYGSLLDNRGKRGLAIDLAGDDGRDVLRRLVTAADVFVTNYPIAARGRLGIDEASLVALNERLIYGSFTAYGEKGEEATKPGFDTTAYWSRSGLMDQVRTDGAAVPARSVAGMGDHPSAMSMYAGIVTALLQRERTGKGTVVRSSLLANGLWANGFLGTAALNAAPFTPRPPREEAMNALTCHYRCADDAWIVLAVLNEERQWPLLADGLGLSHLKDDPRFLTKPDRLASSRELVACFDEAFGARPRAHWVEVLRAAGIVFEMVATPQDIHDDLQARTNGYVVDYPALPGVRSVATPFFVDGVPTAPASPPPSPGQHTAELLAELGYADADIARMRATGTIA
ncbi:CaiB/BaiF CoA transferase family protein [Cumulibacter manganitolerans]|uniref:CaiB/BaiF CoA transferase family protein n=1 Tax=Cumulibacter manganitolerans TaxID=1884992 RepID=UPI0012975813|nr:CoA transferase [Cumulibacter manganitolerans]